MCTFAWWSNYSLRLVCFRLKVVICVNFCAFWGFTAGVQMTLPSLWALGRDGFSCTNAHSTWGHAELLAKSHRLVKKAGIWILDVQTLHTTDLYSYLYMLQARSMRKSHEQYICDHKHHAAYALLWCIIGIIGPWHDGGKCSILHEVCGDAATVDQETHHGSRLTITYTIWVHAVHVRQPLAGLRTHCCCRFNAGRC